VKLVGEPNDPMRVWDNATADELRAEIMHHLGVLIEGGVIDFEALPASKSRAAN
jgi:hypothetical protein